ncbi:MAG: iron-containing alcohol dehydrogenase, partial [Flavobacterium sp.]
MNNFELYNPTRYIFGKGQISKLKDLISGQSKVLLAYGGGSIFNNGIYQQVIEALQGVEVIEFGGIEANPRYETLMKAVDIIRAENITFILAVGGGSVIDGVKFISGAVHFPGDALDILKKRILIKETDPVIPFGTV